MKHRRATLAFLALAAVLLGPPGRAAGAPTDPAADDAAMRKADAEWAAAARTANLEAWMSFYANDAIVLLPKDALTSGKDPIRRAVTHLLALPHLSIAWRPIEVNVARSGDLAFVIGAYELRFDDSHGAPVADRGRRLEVWRKQPDAAWKCIVDTWSLDEPIAAGAPPAPSAQSPPLPAAALESGPPAPAAAREAGSRYGDQPVHYEEAIREYFREHLKHPESIQYREITRPVQGYLTQVTGGFLMREKREYGWTVRATIDAKDADGGSGDSKIYMFLFRGEDIVDARLSLPGMR